VRDIVLLLECMFDGSVLRLFVDGEIVRWGEEGDPPALDSDKLSQTIAKVCDAMFDIAWACSEPGLLADPRRLHPTDPRAETIDGIVVHATERYAAAAGDEVVVEPVEAARAAGTDEELARQVFPDAGDLADSVLRNVVGQAEEIGHWKVRDPGPWIESILRVLSSASTSHAAAVVASQSHPPTRPPEAYFIEELKQTIAGLLDVSDSFRTDAAPVVEAGHLVDLALQGEIGWVGAKAVLERASLRASAD
jgi:hypothetical protein